VFTYHKLALILWTAGIAGAWWKGYYTGYGWLGIVVVTWLVGILAVVIAAAFTGRLYGFFGIRD